MLLKQWIVNYKVKKIKKNKISYKNYINLIKKKKNDDEIIYEKLRFLTNSRKKLDFDKRNSKINSIRYW